MRIAVALLVLASVATVACMGRVSPPPRPKGVPLDAVWAGGVDGGSFISCSYNAANGLNLCAVYNDYTGQREAQGQFKISGPTRAEDVGRFAYSAFDGKKIYLKDGSVLAPSVPTVPEGK